VAERPLAPGAHYAAFVDMSGGSSDDAVLAIGHKDPDGRAVLDLVENQGPPPPFDPNKAVTRFVATLRRYRLTHIVGDKYAGETFRAQFQDAGIAYAVSPDTKHQLYEAMEAPLNGHAIALLDVPILEQQLLGLIWRGGKIDHLSGEHDDYANAVAGLVRQLRVGVNDAAAAEVRRLAFADAPIEGPRSYADLAVTPSAVCGVPWTESGLSSRDHLED
jgi:hypothetical protein